MKIACENFAFLWASFTRGRWQRHDVHYKSVSSIVKTETINHSHPSFKPIYFIQLWSHFTDFFLEYVNFMLHVLRNGILLQAKYIA